RYDAQVRQTLGVLSQNRRRIVAGPVIDDDPHSWWNTLSCNAVQRAAHVLGFIPTGRNECIAARGFHGSDSEFESVGRNLANLYSSAWQALTETTLPRAPAAVRRARPAASYP